MAYRTGSVVQITFLYKPTQTGVATNVLNTDFHAPAVGTRFHVGSEQNTADLDKKIQAWFVGNSVTIWTPTAIPVAEMIFTTTYITAQ